MDAFLPVGGVVVRFSELLSNFNLPDLLLVGCDGLEKDAARFRSRRQPDVEVGDAVCGNSTEDALHFILFCPALATARTNLLRAAPGSILSLLLDPVTRPIQFADHMFGTCWVDNDEFQSFCIEFLHRLRLARFNLLYNQPGPCKDNSSISGGKK